jgi:PAS domain S-box-containing protein
MADLDKETKQLVKQIRELRSQVAELEMADAKRAGVERELIRRQRQLEQRTNQLLALQKVTASIQRSLDLGEVLQLVAQAVVENLEYDHAYVLALDREKNVLKGTAFFSKGGAKLISDVERAIQRPFAAMEMPLIKGYSRGMDYALSGQVMVARYLYEIGEPPLTREQCDAVQKLLKSKTIVSVPLFVADQYIGSIIALTEKEDPSEIDLEPLKHLAGQAVVAAENARLYDEIFTTYQQLRESQEISRGMLESAATGIFLVQDGKWVYVSPLFTQIAGYTSEEMIGTYAPDYVHPDDRETSIKNAIASLKGERDTPYEFRFLKKGGEPIWLLEKVASIGYNGKRATIGSAMDITELKLTEKALRESEGKLRFMFESMGDGVVVTDLDGKVLEANRAALQMAGYDNKADIMGHSVFDFIAERDRAQAIEENLRNITEEHGSTVEYTAVDKEGRKFDAEAIGAMLRDGLGNPAGFIVAIRDVTERKKIEQMKTDFVSLVSHQLKTPVAGVKAYIENMLGGLAGDLTQKQAQYLADMRELCNRNYRLVSDLLNISMIERGVLTVDLQPVQLRDIVELALKDYAADIRDKGLALNLEETAADIVVIADEGKLVEALRNIIHNALKFTDNGSITIRTGSEGEYGTIEVTDTGRGMSDRELETLFVKEKVLSGGPKAGEGATLGLYIARGFMERQHGDITVTSAVGKGSTFTLKVPRK